MYFVESEVFFIIGILCIIKLYKKFYVIGLWGFVLNEKLIILSLFFFLFLLLVFE